MITDVVLRHQGKFSLILESALFYEGAFAFNKSFAVFNEVTFMIDEGKPFELAYLDFAKVCDKIQYQ